MISTKQLLQGAAMNHPNSADLIASLERELGLRLRVYPRLIENGKMTQDKAEWEIACTQAMMKYFKGGLL